MIQNSPRFVKWVHADGLKRRNEVPLSPLRHRGMGGMATAPARPCGISGRRSPYLVVCQSRPLRVEEIFEQKLQQFP